MRRFGEKLRLLRTRQGMTLREVAAALGQRSHSHITQIEFGRRKPSVELVMKVAQLFNVTPDLLLRDELDLPAESDTATDINDTS
jgi:transcriptional regulator with XRE-family HTH domain